MSLKLPIDFAKKIADTLTIKTEIVEQLFDIEERKDGFFYAVLKSKQFLDKFQFRAMCRLVKDLGGQDYLQGAKAWAVPGPFAKKGGVTPQGTSTPVTAGTAVTPNVVKDDKSKPLDLGPIPIKPGYYAKFAICNILSPVHKFRSNIEDGIEEFIEQIATTKAGHEIAIILEPLVCRPAPASSGYIEVGCGERRLLAARKMGLGVVPVIVKEFADEEFDRIRLMENVARKDMSDYDLAKALKHLMDKYPKTYPTQANLADVFGKEHNWVTRHLDMLNLDNIVPRGTMESGEFTERQAREILAAPEAKKQEIIDEINKTGEVPSAREIHSIVHPEEKAPPIGTVKPQDMTVGKARELLDTPAGKEVLETAVKERFAEGPSEGAGESEEEDEGPLYADGIETIPEKDTESISKAHEPNKESIPSPHVKDEKIDTGFEFCCPECQLKFQILHVKRADGKIEHCLEAKY